MKKLKGIDGKLDDAWSLLVKLRNGNKCAVCLKTSPLNSHHIYSRSNKSVRWDVLNGICLCVGCHTFSSKFSAHKTPTEFTYWLERKFGKQFMEKLMLKAHGLGKFTPFEKEIMLKELKEEIKTYE